MFQCLNVPILSESRQIGDSSVKQHSNTGTFKHSNTKKMEQKLRNVLKANAVFSMLSGAAMLIFSQAISDWMNIANPIVLMIIGGGLILFGGFVWYQGSRKSLNLKEVKSIIIQDWLWVIGSVVIIGLQLFQINFQGYILMGIIALIVADFAFFQRYFLKRI